MIKLSQLSRLFFGVFCLFSLNLSAQSLNNEQFKQFLSILARVESGGKTNAVGDNGKAIGIYQIHYSYWKDAIEYSKSIGKDIGGKYNDCFDPEYAAKIVSAYLSRYCKGGTWEEMARCHNSGPQWKKKYHLTNKYWEKFKLTQKEKISIIVT